MKLNIRQMLMHAVAVFFATACVAEMNEAPQGIDT